MLAKACCFALVGTSAYRVEVEADVANGLPMFDIVGLPDAAVKEARERVRAAIKNSGFTFPAARVVVNLAPAGKRKEGALYDLPIALAILSATEQLPPLAPDEAFAAELSLDGALRSVRGVLSLAMAAKEYGLKRIFVPEANAAEAALVDGVEVLGALDLRGVAAHLNGIKCIEPQPRRPWSERASAAAVSDDISYVRGQHNAKRALEIAASGAHNLLMSGPPGAGKTMLAKCLPSILPPLTFEEALEVIKIRSIVYDLGEEELGAERPFRSPHHTASVPSLVGGGQSVRPGEISLAHLGVLYMDELPEFAPEALEALRQPLEDGKITVARVSMTVSFPARIMLVASMNPCPCGYYGDYSGRCSCPPEKIRRYAARISGPLMDRIDLHVPVEAVEYSELAGRKPTGETSSEVRGRVASARETQRKRYTNEGIYTNSQLDGRTMPKYCKLDKESERMMAEAYERLGMTARGHNRVLRVARTIADMDGKTDISLEHLAEALRYRGGA